MDHLRGHIKRVLYQLKTDLDAKRLGAAQDPVEQAREDASWATQPDQGMTRAPDTCCREELVRQPRQMLKFFRSPRSTIHDDIPSRVGHSHLPADRREACAAIRVRADAVSTAPGLVLIRPPATAARQQPDRLPLYDRRSCASSAAFNRSRMALLNAWSSTSVTRCASTRRRASSSVTRVSPFFKVNDRVSFADQLTGHLRGWVAPMPGP
jgi:hypothetical protein